MNRALQRSTASMTAGTLILAMLLATSTTVRACNSDRALERAVAETGGSLGAPGDGSASPLSNMIGIVLPPLVRTLAAEGTARFAAAWWASRTRAERELIVSAVAVTVAAGVIVAAEALVQDTPAGSAVRNEAPHSPCPRSGRLV